MAHKNFKLPKRVGGMKLPKKMRKMGNSVLANPLGRQLLAAILVQAGTAMVGRQSQAGSTARRFLSHPIASTRSAGGAVAEAGGDAASAVSQAAGGLSSLFADAFEGVIGRNGTDTAKKKSNGRKSGNGKAKGRRASNSDTREAASR